MKMKAMKKVRKIGKDERIEKWRLGKRERETEPEMAH